MYLILYTERQLIISAGNSVCVCICDKLVRVYAFTTVALWEVHAYIVALWGMREL